MSYSAAIDSIIAAVQAIQPTWDSDIPFRCFEDASGYVVPVDEVVDDSPRIFDIRSRGVIDDGASGYVFTRFRASLEMRVRYTLPTDRGRVDRMVMSDIPKLINALIHPSSWHESICTIPPPGSPTISTVTNRDGGETALILTVPFEMVYLDELTD